MSVEAIAAPEGHDMRAAEAETEADPVLGARPDLYSWQGEALRAWRRHGYRGVVEAVTGSGKTRVGIAAAHQALAQGIKVLIVVPTKELRLQWLATLKRSFRGVRFGSLGDGHEDSFDSCDVLVAIVNSAATRRTLQRRRAGLLIADECHRYGAPYFRTALQESYTWRLGLTATYQRRDDFGSDQLGEYFGSVVYTMWYPQALAAGIIAPFDIALAGVQFDPAEQLRYDELSEAISSDNVSLRTYLEELGLMGREEFMDAVVRISEDPSSGPAQFVAKRYLSALSERQQLLANTAAKVRALATLAPAVRASGKSLVFGHSQESARTAKHVLGEAGVAADCVMSGMPKVERLRAMSGFRDGRLQALAAPRVLDEGVDVPEADLAVVTSGTSQERQMIQRLGRVIRKKPDGGAGRLVYLYVQGTIEDPAMKEEFLPSVLPYARRTGYFDVTGDVEALLAFLSPDDRRASDGHGHRTPGPNPDDSDLQTPRTSGEPVVIDFTDEEAPPERISGGRPVTTDAVKDYLKSLGRHPLLKDEEQADCAERIEAGLYAEHILETRRPETRREIRELRYVVRDGEAAFDTMVQSNMRLVVSIAKRYTHRLRSLDFLDVIQEGMFGLITAVKHFDHRYGTKFSTYATWWVRQSIQRAIDRSDRPIRLPVHVEERLVLVRRSEGELERAGRPTDAATVSETSEVPEEELRRLFHWRQSVLSLDLLFYDGNSWVEFGSQLHCSEDPTLEDLFDHRYRRSAVHEALDTLGPRPAEVLAQRFGLADGRDKTLEEIGRLYGVTRERIRQIEKKALTELGEMDHLAGYL